MLPKPKVVNVSKGELFDVYIGRPGPWGNPFVIGKDGSREEVIRKFENLVINDVHFKEAVKIHLRGKVLGCHCSPEACHGDVLLRIANGD